MVVGITGGPASGKSTVTRMLAQRGAVTFSADEAARAVQSAGGALVCALTAEFGSDILHPDGSLDRAGLASRVFGDPAALKRLNQLTHPAIVRLLRSQIDGALADLRRGTMILVEAPLLFEANLANWFERIIVVVASESTLIARLQARNALTSDQARARLNSQWPIEDKQSRANYIISNDGSLSDLERAVDRLWVELRHEGPGDIRNC